MKINQTETLKSSTLNTASANNKQISGIYKSFLKIQSINIIIKYFFLLGSPTKKPEIISILKHKSDITLNTQLYNGNVSYK